MAVFVPPVRGLPASLIPIEPGPPVVPVRSQLDLLPNPPAPFPLRLMPLIRESWRAARALRPVAAIRAPAREWTR